MENTVKVLFTTVSRVKLKDIPNNLNKCFSLPVENVQATTQIGLLKNYTSLAAGFVCGQKKFICLASETALRRTQKLKVQMKSAQPSIKYLAARFILMVRLSR